MFHYSYWGWAGSLVPVAGDWKNDGKDELGVYDVGAWLRDTDGSHAWDAANQAATAGPQSRRLTNTSSDNIRDAATPSASKPRRLPTAFQALVPCDPGMTSMSWLAGR